MSIFGSSSSARNEDVNAKIWTNEDTIICLSRKYCGKGEIAQDEQFLLLPQCFQNQSVVDVSK